MLCFLWKNASVYWSSRGVCFSQTAHLFKGRAPLLRRHLWTVPPFQVLHAQFRMPQQWESGSTSTHWLQAATGPTAVQWPALKQVRGRLYLLCGTPRAFVNFISITKGLSMSLCGKTVSRLARVCILSWRFLTWSMSPPLLYRAHNL